MTVDYAKWDKIQDSDDEEDYDAYLRSRYGVTSGWRGPDSGDAPPILGGRTPGKEVEDFETGPTISWGGEDDAEPEDGDESPVEISRGHKCAGCALAALRLLESMAWLLPAVSALLTFTAYFGNIDLETVVYPAVCAASVVAGLFDVLLAALGGGALLPGGPDYASELSAGAAVAFSCWLKRGFIAMSFLVYEASFPRDDGVSRILRLSSGLIMISFWMGRKVWGYASDIRTVHRALCSAEGELPGSDPGNAPNQWVMRLFYIEGVAEFACAAVHAAMLPESTNFLGFEDTRVAIAASGFWLISCNVVAVHMLAKQQDSQAPIMKEASKED